MLIGFKFKSLSLIILGFFILSISCFGQTPYPLTDTTVNHRLDAHVEIFIDSTDSFLIDQITAPEFQSHFTSKKGNLKFGYVRSPIWLKIKTRTFSPYTQWLLEIPAPFLEYVDFYQRQNENWSYSMAGQYRPHSVRDISHTGHVFRLHYGADSISTVYVKIAGQSPKTFPLFVLEEGRFNRKVRFEDLGYGIFFGMLIVMFFFNFFIYLTLRQTNYLIYICTIVCAFFIFGTATGYASKFLWPENPEVNFYTGRMSLGVFVIFLSVFAIRFLEVKQYSKSMYYILLSLIPLAVLSPILVITNTLSSAGNNLISISVVLYMVTGIVCSIKGNKTAYYFIAAWTMYLIGGLLLTLRNSGIFDFNFWTTHFVEIGAVSETLIIAFALGDRYRRLRREKEEAQLLLIKVQQEATSKLELKVNERTEELSKTNEELNATLETNKLQTKLIEDKNTELDTFFYRTSHDLKGPIASLRILSYLAKQNVKDVEALSYIEKQSQEVERLDSIITGLIKLTKLNDSELQKEKIDFAKLINECIATFRSLPNFSQVAFKKDVQNDVDFYSEWTLLNAIIQNLIENAIKYSNDQSPSVQIRVSYASGNIIIEVEDNGQGIAMEHQPKIFEMFYRANNNANGAGLGLYILKRSVSRLKGTVEIKSELGAGSIFTVKLPSLVP